MGRGWISTISDIPNLLMWDSWYKSDVRNQSTKVYLKGFVKLFHWRSHWGPSPQPFVEGYCWKMLPSPQYRLGPSMWTASGETFLNLAAHTCTHCLTPWEQKIVWLLRNYRIAPVSCWIVNFSPYLQKGIFSGRKQHCLRFEIFQLETGGTILSL